MLIDTISLELFSHTDDWKAHGQIFVRDDLFILRRFDIRRREFLVPSKPYLLQEGRVVYVRRGAARYTFDLVDYEFQAGDLVVFFADTLIEKQGHSDDFQFDAFCFPQQQGIKESFVRLRLNEQSQPLVEQHFALLWTLAHQQPYPAGSIRHLIGSLLDFVSLQEQSETAGSRPVNRRDDTIRRFLSLVSRHASHERTISFYADQLCLAPHYLSSLVKQSTGRTVMQWINQAAVKEIKAWLAYSDESAAQIAFRLNFPHPSSLTKFFKRETGLTPSEYRCRETTGLEGMATDQSGSTSKNTWREA